MLDGRLYLCTDSRSRTGDLADFLDTVLANGVDIVHIGPSAKQAGEIQKKYLGRTSQGGDAGTGAVDHIAFRATGRPAIRVQKRTGGRTSGAAIRGLAMRWAHAAPGVGWAPTVYDCAGSYISVFMRSPPCAQLTRLEAIPP